MSLSPLSRTVRTLTRQAIGVRQPALAGLVSSWADVVGTVWAARCLPGAWRQAPGQGGVTLELLVTPGTAPLVQHELPILEERIQAFFGHQLVSKIRLRQVDKLLPPSFRRPSEPPLLPVSAVDNDLAEALGRLGRRLKS